MEYIIYRISLINDTSTVYIGSTTNFTIRKYQHKRLCEKKENMKIYNIINESGGWENAEMKPLEKLICSKMEASIREEYYREQYKATLNSIKCYVPPEEKKDNQKTYFQNYRDKNKEHLKGLWHKSYIKNKDKKIKKIMEIYIFKKEVKRLMAINI